MLDWNLEVAGQMILILVLGKYFQHSLSNDKKSIYLKLHMKVHIAPFQLWLSSKTFYT